MSAVPGYLTARLREAAPLLTAKKVMAGFDGFVDSIVRVVNQKGERGDTTTAPTHYFQTLGEFGQYILDKQGAGFSLETEERVQKAGGNMPIMAGALAALGASVDCIGALGMPELHPLFADMHPRCRTISFANPGLTTALEFGDGKIFLGQMKDLNAAGWNTVKDHAGLGTLIDSYLCSDLICLVNWSEIDTSSDIWEGLLAEVIPAGRDTGRPREFFFDLSDCSKRSPAAIRDALRLIAAFGRSGKVTLSLNRNEAGVLYKSLLGKDGGGNGPAGAAGGEVPGDPEVPGSKDGGAGADPEILGAALAGLLPVDTLLIHGSKISLAWQGQMCYSNRPLFISEPMLSTGAGDHFNAGYCSGLLMGFDPALSLLLADTVAGWYMTRGRSPAIEALTGGLLD